jgi:hypothetical protein
MRDQQLVTYRRFFGRSPLSKGVSPDETEADDNQSDITTRLEAPKPALEQFRDEAEKSRWKSWKKYRSISINETYRKQLNSLSQALAPFRAKEPSNYLPKHRFMNSTGLTINFSHEPARPLNKNFIFTSGGTLNRVSVHSSAKMRSPLKDETVKQHVDRDYGSFTGHNRTTTKLLPELRH